MHDKLAIVCPHVFTAERAVNLVVHHADGDLQFACGDYDHAEDASGAEAVHASHIFERHPELAEIVADLKPGWLAERTDTGWEFAAHDD